MRARRALLLLLLARPLLAAPPSSSASFDPWLGGWSGRQDCSSLGPGTAGLTLSKAGGLILGRFTDAFRKQRGSGSGTLEAGPGPGLYLFKIPLTLGRGLPYALEGVLRLSADGKKADFDSGSGSLAGWAALERGGKVLRYSAQLSFLGLQERCLGELTRSGARERPAPEAPGAPRQPRKPRPQRKKTPAPIEDRPLVPAPADRN